MNGRHLGHRSSAACGCLGALVHDVTKILAKIGVWRLYWSERTGCDALGIFYVARAGSDIEVPCYLTSCKSRFPGSSSARRYCVFMHSAVLWVFGTVKGISMHVISTCKLIWPRPTSVAVSISGQERGCWYQRVSYRHRGTIRGVAARIRLQVIWTDQSISRDA